MYFCSKNINMKKRITKYGGICTLIMCSIIICYIHYFNQWKHIWERCPQIPLYTIDQHEDDTLRVGMIGDSWAYLHDVIQMDTFLSRHLADMLHKPVKVVSKGKNGEITREIYKYMFTYGVNGTRCFFDNGLDYCIISAGINDAVRNLGVKQYAYHYRLIIDFLNSNSVCPIVIEIPDANIWDSQFNKPYKEIAVDYVRSIMVGSPMYNCAKYRDELKNTLINDSLLKDIIYIPLSAWNGTQLSLRNDLSLSDHIHLNLKGYEKLDSAIIYEIIKREQGKLHHFREEITHDSLKSF